MHKFSLSFSLTHTHKLSHTHTHTHSHTFSLSLSHTHSHTQSLSHTLILSLTHRNSHTNIYTVHWQPSNVKPQCRLLCRLSSLELSTRWRTEWTDCEMKYDLFFFNQETLFIAD